MNGWRNSSAGTDMITSTQAEIPSTRYCMRSGSMSGCPDRLVTNPLSRANNPTASTPLPTSGATSAIWLEKVRSMGRATRSRVAQAHAASSDARVMGMYHSCGHCSTIAHSAVAAAWLPSRNR